MPRIPQLTLDTAPAPMKSVMKAQLHHCLVESSGAG
jgi:hypothetical protein